MFTSLDPRASRSLANVNSSASARPQAIAAIKLFPRIAYGAANGIPCSASAVGIGGKKTAKIALTNSHGGIEGCSVTVVAGEGVGIESGDGNEFNNTSFLCIIVSVEKVSVYDVLDAAFFFSLFFLDLRV